MPGTRGRRKSTPLSRPSWSGQSENTSALQVHADGINAGPGLLTSSGPIPDHHADEKNISRSTYSKSKPRRKSTLPKRTFTSGADSNLSPHKQNINPVLSSCKTDKRNKRPSNKSFARCDDTEANGSRSTVDSFSLSEIDTPRLKQPSTSTPECSFVVPKPPSQDGKFSRPGSRYSVDTGITHSRTRLSNISNYSDIATRPNISNSLDGSFLSHDNTDLSDKWTITKNKPITERFSIDLTMSKSSDSSKTWSLPGATESPDVLITPELTPDFIPDKAKEECNVTIKTPNVESDASFQFHCSFDESDDENEIAPTQKLDDRPLKGINQ